ncbi:MAG: TonB-dependent receptor [Caulobacteraceae bacterium]|nr:TonB-dependent receptor [Caulobacteraceae bacterium]
MNSSAFPIVLIVMAAAPPALAQTPADATVEGVVVTAQKPKSQVLIDRKTYVVSGDLQAATGSAADVLDEVPSVDVDADGNVTLRGDPNVTILVDGKPSARFSGPSAGLALLQYPASEIERIEVMTDPPAQYKASGSAGVINIVTKRRRASGLSGSARLSGGEYGRANLGVDASYNAGGLSLTGGVGLRHDVRDRLSTSDRVETDPVSGAPTRTRETIDEHFHRLTPTLSGGLEDQLNERQSFGASFNVLDLSGHRYFDQHDLGGPPGQPIDNDTARHSDGHERHVDASEQAHFVQRLWRPDETLTLTLQHSTTAEHENYAYANTSALPAAPPSFDDLYLNMDLAKTEFSLDYDRPMAGKAELKLGYDLEADDNRFDDLGHDIDPASGAATIDPNVTNDFRYRQSVHALYGDYRTPVGRWTLDAGLRAEAARASWLLVAGRTPGHRSDAGLYPSLRLERALGDSDKVSLNLGRRVTRPDPEALNPFVDHQDSYNLRAGAPGLAPQDTWSAELGYLSSHAVLTYGATAYWRIDRNAVTDVVQPLGGGVVLLTKANLPKSQSAGLEFNASGKLLRRLSYSLSGAAFYTQIDAAALGVTVSGAPALKSTTGLNLKASLEYRPTTRDTLQASFSRTDRRLTPQGYVAAINLVNLGVKHQLRPDLAVVLTVSDALDGQKLRRFETTPLLRDTYQRYQVGRIASLGLVYAFGGPAKSKTGDFGYAQ